MGGSRAFFELKANTPAFGRVVSSVLAVLGTGSECSGAAFLTVAFVSLMLTVVTKAFARVLGESNCSSLDSVDAVILEDAIPVGLSVGVAL